MVIPALAAGCSQRLGQSCPVRFRFLQTVAARCEPGLTGSAGRPCSAQPVSYTMMRCCARPGNTVTA